MIILRKYCVYGLFQRSDPKKEDFDMANLTSKELTALEDQIGCEETLVK